MNKKQVLDLLEYLDMSYANFGGVQNKLAFWYDELQYYSNSEVKGRLNELMQLKEFSTNCPTLSRIIAPLTKISEKIENSDMVYFCQFCGRSFKDYGVLETHQDRCRSVKYILKQYERFGLGKVDKRSLYELPENEFDLRYKKLLRLIQQKTTDANEKRIIECIFNPPSKEEALSIINEGIY